MLPNLGDHLLDWKTSRGTHDFADYLKDVLTRERENRILVLDSVEKTALKAAVVEGRAQMIREIIDLIEEKKGED